MTDMQAAAGGPAAADPFGRLEGPLAGLTRMRLEVVESRALTPRMQRLVLTAPELAGMEYEPGQDVMLLVGGEGERPIRRRYTIRALDHARRLLTMDIVRHGQGPGERWLSTAQPGDTVEAAGPRGKIFVSAEADWHLFIGDESAMAAFFAMAESLPAGVPAIVLLEVPGPEDEQDLAAGEDVRLTWLHRGEAPAGDPAALARAAAGASLPAGRGQAYLAGEARMVLQLREVLAGRGFTPERISPKAYWGRGRANGAHGEPAREG